MQKQTDFHFQLQTALKNSALLLEPVKELIGGIKTNTIPWHICASWTAGSALVLFFKIDYLIISHTRFSGLYPFYPLLYKVYAFSFSTLAFWVWAWIQVKKKKDKLKTLTNAFKNAGLESKIGRLPNLISDFPLDPMTRKMRLTNAGFPVMSFRNQSKYIESELVECGENFVV